MPVGALGLGCDLGGSHVLSIENDEMLAGSERSRFYLEQDVDLLDSLHKGFAHA